ncbi:MAG: hypothetical protein HDT47_09575, partial [Ruminococcaceae bacterium]|nr:hypothetical protein [Oscillospiraceae bacterium]
MANEMIKFDERNITRDSLLRLYSLFADSNSAKPEAVQKEMQARDSGQLPVSESNVMFPRYIAIGTSLYPNEFFNSMESDKLKELFSCGQNELSLPVYADLLNTSGIFVECDESGLAECQKFTHNIMWSFLSGIPAAKLNISVFDCEKRGGSITPFLEFNKKVPEAFDGKIFTDKESVNGRLKKYGEMIDERIQFKLGTNFDSIIEYNRQNPLKEENIHLIVINDFPSGFGSDSANSLLSILKNGGKCGIYTVVNFNRNIKYSEYENLDPVIDLIRKNSDVFEIKEQRCFYWNLTNPVESDIHISESAAEDFIEKYLDKVKALSNSKLPLRIILDSGLFERSSEDLLEIPLGIGDGGNRIQLKLGKGSSHHSLIAGATGSGKSSLLHTLILSAMLHYNPDELNLYLMDFKSGTEFKIYEKYRLPHIKLLALDAKQEFGESILENLVTEMTERGGKFKSVGAASLKEYKKATGEAMPRILVVIDEFQVLFNESQNREVARNCAELAKRIVTEGRSFGIHLIMATQSTAIISELSLSAGVIEQMRIRIGMKCGENDARFMFRDNSQKALELMKGPTGTAVINPECTEKENIGFRVAYCDDDFRDNCLQIIEEEFTACKYTMQTFEGNRVKKLFDRYAENQGEDKEQANVSAEVGELIKVAPPLKIVFDKKRNHNVLICGADEKMADNIFNEFMLGTLKSGKANVYFTDGDALVDEEAFMPFCLQYQRFDGQFRSAQNNSDIVEHLNEIYEQFKKRKKEKSSGAIFVMLRNLQYIDLFKKLLKGDFVDESEYTDAAEDTQDNGSDSFFDFTGAGSGNKDGLTEKFSRLVNEGSAYGIHFIISCTDYQTVRENMHYGSNVLAKFTERFVFGMNDSDAGYLIDNVSMTALDDNTVYYFDCIKNICQVKPYLFPAAEELKNYIDSGMDDTQLPRGDKKYHSESPKDNLHRLAVKKLSVLSGNEGGAAVQDSSDADNEQGQFVNLGRMYYYGYGVPQDYNSARQWYEKAVEKGNSKAMFSLGVIYHTGNGVPLDYNLARQWYEKAAEKGNSYAMFNIGLLYKNGQGVPQDYNLARQWYEKAAEMGNSGAMNSLGVLYDNGQGVPQDYNLARQWYEKAAEMGHSGAMNKLGLLYENGQGVPQDYNLARQWWEKAAENGDSGAMFNLGLLYKNGQGVPQDYNLAR